MPDIEAANPKRAVKKAAPVQSSQGKKRQKQPIIDNLEELKAEAIRTGTTIRISKRGRVNDGRPTRYYPELCDELLKFFGAVEEPYRETDVTIGGKNWERTEVKLLPNKLPTLEAFCWKHKLLPEYISRWVDEYDDFRQAVTLVKAWQKELIVQGGLSGVYDSKFAMFTAINVTDMRNTITYDAHVTVQQLRDPAERRLLADMAKEMGSKILQAQGKLIDVTPTSTCSTEEKSNK